MNEQHLKDREENQQLTNLYKVIYSLLTLIGISSENKENAHL